MTGPPNRPRARGPHPGAAARPGGFTFIELIIFLVIVAVLATGLLTAFTGALRGAGEPERLTRATLLAQERMELILGQRNTLGFAGFTAATFDPCTSAPPSAQAACTATPAGYAVSAALVDNWAGDFGYQVVTVDVTGTGSARLTALVADF